MEEDNGATEKSQKTAVEQFRARCINRGTVGSWEKGGVRTLFGFGYLGIVLGLTGLLVVCWINDLPVGGVAVLLLMSIMGLGDSEIEYAIAWLWEEE